MTPMRSINDRVGVFFVFRVRMVPVTVADLLGYVYGRSTWYSLALGRIGTL